MVRSQSAQVVARVAQRRVALLLLPLRVFMGIEWLRRGLAKFLQPEWFDGSALRGFLEGQAADAPIALYSDIMIELAGRFAAPMGMAFALGEVAIGIGLVTGTLTNFALLMAIALNVNLVLAGIGSPSRYHIVIQLVLLAGGAGSDFSVDRSLSRYLRTSLLTAGDGVVGDGGPPRAGLLALAATMIGLAVGLVVGGVATRSALLPDGGQDAPGYTMVILLGVTALLAIALLAARRAGDGDDGMLSAADFASSSPAGVPPPPPRPGPPPTARAGMPPPPPDLPERTRVPAAASFEREAATATGTLPAPRPVPAGRGDGADPRARNPRGPDPMQPRPVQPWPDPPAPAEAPPNGRPARQDQPTTQFARQRRRRAPERPDDPYAELRDLPPRD